MQTFKRFGYMFALVVAATMLGCSTTNNEPVYADVPSASASAVPSEVAQPIPPQELTPPATKTTPAATPAEATKTATEKSELIVTPDDTLTGAVVSVNDVGRFVVLRFPLGRIPAVDTRLFVYRQGLKVAELKVTGPQKDDHTVADIKTGDCRVSDEVRDR